MATSIWNDIGTESILSAHISGLSHSIKKFEETLNMKEKSSSFTLLPVNDQEDLSLRYRIYEGEHRNWTSFSLTRNGQPIDSDEYVIQPAYGVVVFHSPQNQTDIIEVEASYIDSESTRISSIETELGNQASSIEEMSGTMGTHNSDIGTMKSDISTLKSDVKNLQDSGTGGGGTPTPSKPTNAGVFNLSTGPERIGNVRPGIYPTYNAAEVAPLVTMAVWRLDAIPIILTEEKTINSLMMVFHSSSPTCNNLFGIYDDNGSVYPGSKLAEVSSRHGILEHEKLIADLPSPITLQPGTYWLVKWHNDAARITGEVFHPLVHISIDPPSEGVTDFAEGSELSRAHGVRTQSSTGNLTTLPAVFPSLGTSSKYLVREGIGNIYAIASS